MDPQKRADHPKQVSALFPLVLRQTIAPAIRFQPHATYTVPMSQALVSPSQVPVPVWKVALPAPLPRMFDYLPLPAHAAPAPGARLRVPFGRQTVVGFFVEAGSAQAQAHALRQVEAVLDETPLFLPELFASLVWAAGYYQRALGEVLATALPVPLRQGEDLPETARRVFSLNETGLTGRAGLRAGSKPRALADFLLTPREETELAAFSPDFRDALRRLEKRGYVNVERRDDAPLPHPPAQSPKPLGEAQRQAVDAINAAAGSFHVLLLDGVTGSGKTEVYLAAIERCLMRGQQALVLVPEIGLTPQALRRYGERLPVPIHALHSGLSDGDRARGFAAMARGQARVLIGTRSAVFSPLPDAGLIIVDEEHDASYKQQDGFRYHARDFALVRARALGIPVVLGSATPSLETLRHAIEGRHGWLRLPERAGGAVPPQVRVLDIRAQRLQHGLSQPLLAAIAACLERGEQALVFRNRRGYAPVLLCHDCGWHADCERCGTPEHRQPLTLHGRSRLICHHCGARRKLPPACPACGSLALHPQGHGTERLEEALAHAFPDARLIRVDRETTRHRDALAAHFDALGDGPGILVGTQMLAKGHDLPNLTLVAIASLDDGLFSTDFRATERTAQLLVQVAGRAGRASKPGQVLIQTHYPEHPLLQLLVREGYHAFAHAALAERQAAQLPPYSHLCLLRAECAQQAPLDEFLAAAHALTQPFSGIAAHPPLPAPMPRRAGRLRAQMLLEATHRPALQAALRELFPALGELPQARRVRWSLDVDPMDLY